MALIKSANAKNRFSDFPCLLLIFCLSITYSALNENRAGVPRNGRNSFFSTWRTFRFILSSVHEILAAGLARSVKLLDSYMYWSTGDWWARRRVLNSRTLLQIVECPRWTSVKAIIATQARLSHGLAKRRQKKKLASWESKSMPFGRSWLSLRKPWSSPLESESFSQEMHLKIPLSSRASKLSNSKPGCRVSAPHLFVK